MQPHIIILKYTSFFIFLMIQSLTLFAQESLNYTITGTLPDNENDGSIVYLSILSPFTKDTEGMDIDSAKVINNQFVFKGILTDKKPSLYRLSVSSSNIGGLVVLEPGNIEFKYISDEFTGYASVTGTPINNQLTENFTVASYSLQHQMESIIKSLKDKGVEFTQEGFNKEKETTDKIMKINTEFYEKYSGFIKQNIENPVGEYILLLLGVLKEEDIAEITPRMSEETRKKFETKLSENKKRVADMMSAQNKSTIDSAFIGKQYFEITGKTPDGKEIVLSDIVKSNKLVLLDFWASWCIPCLKEMPNIVEIYEKYREKGLEIIGISLDTDRVFWEKMIAKQKMSWIQIINAKNGEKYISEIYNVINIPSTILIDEKGIIIARNLRDKELMEKIKNTLELHTK